MALDNVFYIDTASISVMTASGSLYGTASYAISASYAPGTAIPYSVVYATQSLFSTQSLVATQSLYATSSITSSFSQTASYYKLFPAIKSNKVSASFFGGTPLTYSVAFTSSYPDNNYSVSIIGGDARVWTMETPIASGFIISSNSLQPLTTYVYWLATYNGESA